MNTIRKILMPLLIIPLGMFVYVFTHPDWQWDSPGLESLFILVGIPILIGNFIAWFYPEVITAYFPVKDDWGEKGGVPVTLAVVLSTLIAVTCVGAGVVSAVSNASDRPTFKPSVKSLTLQPVAATALARSNELQAEIANSSETDIVPIPEQLPQTDTPSEGVTQAPEADILPEPTPQIPVSGGAAISSPTSPVLLSVTRFATQTAVISASTQATQATGQATVTPGAASLCTPAKSDYMDAILQTVQDADSDNTVGAGWAVQSNVATNLWFVAAKVSGPQVDAGTLPGVWGLFVDASGNIDIYSINETAMEYAGADWGEDSDPVLSMQSNGAQASYDCAVHR